MARWCSTLGVGHWITRLQVRLSVKFRLCNDFRQVAHTLMLITKYYHLVQVSRRRRSVAWKVTVGLAMCGRLH